jgi:hypothetical protein
MVIDVNGKQEAIAQAKRIIGEGLDTSKSQLFRNTKKVKIYPPSQIKMIEFDIGT